MTPVIKLGKSDLSSYAKAEDVMSMLCPIILDNGFSHSISAAPSDKGGDWTRFVLKLRHVGGHAEDHHMDAPVDHLGPKGSPVKTKLHGMGSSYTYCERHLLCKVFGVQLVDDNDGNRIKAAEKISVDQSIVLNDLLTERWPDKVEVARDRLLAFFGVSAISEIPVSRYHEARLMISGQKQ